MQALETLIDNASKVCGSDSALARRMGLSRQLLSFMRKGQRKVTPVQAAKLADIARTSVDEALRAATIQSAEGTPDEWLITEIVGKGRAAGGAATLPISYSGKSHLDSAKGSRTSDSAAKLDPLYIVSKRGSLAAILHWSGGKALRTLAANDARMIERHYR